MSDELKEKLETACCALADLVTVEIQRKEGKELSKEDSYFIQDLIRTLNSLTVTVNRINVAPESRFEPN